MTPTTNLMHEWPAVLAHLMRGGLWGYWWSDRRDDLGRARSRWWPTNQPAPLPGISESVGNWYFSVCPALSRGGPHQRVKAEGIAAANCLFGDFDAKALGGMSAAITQVNMITPAPTVVICTGGGYHAYWLFNRPFTIGTDNDRKWIADLLKRWVGWIGADPACADLARVLRVPGTQNRKYAPAREVRLVRVDWQRIYGVLELEAALPTPAPRVTATTRARDLYDAAMHPRHSGGDPAAWAEGLLDKVSSARADNYQDWVTVGMCLQDLGDRGLELWEAWSQQSPKYRPGDCETKWRSFDGPGLSLGTLYHFAMQDGR